MHDHHRCSVHTKKGFTFLFFISKALKIEDFFTYFQSEANIGDRLYITIIIYL